jgi:tetratricopeptide (TPR) repeat protein
LEEAVDLYRGSLLEGFSLADSPLFEEWALLERERLHRLVTDALRQLANLYEQRGKYSTALGHARRLLDLDPLLEPVHRQAMRLLVYDGERGAALAQYAACRRVLAEHVGVTPSPETERLYEQIRSGAVEITVAPPMPLRESPIQRPSFLAREVAVQVERPVFVAREWELARLDRYLEQAVAGQGQVVFVIGGPGRGKTMLLEAFARRAMATHPDLLVAGGNGNAYAGVGDPYLPFRDALEMLAGDVEARWTAGAIDRDHALRLWHALPLTAQALVELGPDLVDTFIPGRALLSRAAAYQDGRGADAVWRTQLEFLIARKASLPPDPNLQRSALFRQYTRMLIALAWQRPLLLVLDDLQWLDMGSIGLLFHLGRELPRCRILILGAYRPEEVATGHSAPPQREGSAERHPFEGVLAEFKRRYGDVWLDLGLTDAS